MNTITITLPDGTKETYDSGITTGEIAKGIGEGLFRASIASKVNGKEIDLNTPIIEDANIEIITTTSEEAHEILLHSTAHLLAQAVKELYPTAKIAIGPAIENRFYYDIDVEESINEEVLIKIENKMKDITKSNYIVERKELTKAEAIKTFKDLNEDYKVEILEQIEDGDIISAYSQDQFIDLCRGPHVASTGVIKHFKLLSTAGAYWRGNENNKMLQRIYGTAWYSKKEMEAYLERLEEAKKRDHRKLGKQMEIYTFDEEIGPGLPLWLPNGTAIIDELEKLAKDTETEAGYKRVKTPHLTKSDLYNRSGHLDLYEDHMFPAMNIDGIDYYVKPMNCPHHHKIYASRPRSYRELPLRLSEYGTCYRYEKSGQLFGLMRVRSMQMNDAHIYCTPDQFKNEFLNVCKMYLKYFDIFGIEKYQMRLSLHDEEGLGVKYVNEPQLWNQTEHIVREALKEGELNFIEVSGEAAFYGPKIDVQVWSAIDKEFTLATNQVDFAIPKRFDLKYVNESGEEETPLCIHRAPLSTHERLIGFLIEHFGGDFPLWLAPMQVIVIPISDKYINYAEYINSRMFSARIRSDIDRRSEKVGAKIRDAELKKIPIMLIIGEKEESEGLVSIRRRHKGDLGTVKSDKFIKDLEVEIKLKAKGAKNS